MEQGKIMEAEVPTVRVGAPTTTTPKGFLQAGCPSCHPTNSVKALKAQKRQTYQCRIQKKAGVWNC